MPHRILAACLAALPFWGCAGTDGTPDDTDTQTDGGPDAGSPLAALVFEVDPVTTPEPVLVELGWLDAEGDGTLTAAPDEDGVSRIKAFTCMDEGATNTAPGIGEQRICTLRQLADRTAGGDFVYADWKDDAACVFDPDNVHAEVNVYHHVQHIYALITSPEVGVFERLPGRHFVGDTKVPLNVVANYRLPAPVSEGSLRPADVAFFVPHEYMVQGMALFQGLPGLLGDVLAFGQGEHTDFGYSGEAICHEFGHAVVHATAAPAMTVPDFQGLSDQPRALDEGLANTFAFLGSGEADLADFLGLCHGEGGPWFDAANGAAFPDSLTGHPVADGDPVLGANWELYRLMLDEWGEPRERFVRVLLRALLALDAPEGAYRFADWASAFLDELVADGLGEREDEARAVLEARGLFEELRAVDATGWQAEDGRFAYLGCAATEPWNTWIDLDDGAGPVPVAPAVFQLRVTVPAGAASLAVSARLFERPSSMGEAGDVDVRVFERAGDPIEWSFEGGSAAALRDASIAATVEPGDGDEGDMATWLIADPAPGEHFLQFVAFGITESLLEDIAVAAD